ncbi:response regulator [Paenibacillus sp. BR2-3]|uniref:response regulator transcription factor n=1 Tax=Paenibacillus sp. BR2-3 TaxID=3048494 RepID=UPI0039773B2D
MNIIVVDDEILARETVISILKEISSDFHIAEADSGQELIELTRQLNPDIAFVDIQMPGKNGLEAIRAALPHTQNTKWVVMTGFAEFKYAREALHLGVIDYLLKPVDPDEVKKLIDHTFIGAKKDLHLQCKQLESRVSLLFNGMSGSWQDESESPRSSEIWQCQLFYVDRLNPDDIEDITVSSFYRSIQEITDEYCRKDMQAAMIRLRAGEYAMITKASSEEGTGRMLQLMDLAREKVRQYASSRHALTVIRSGKYPVLLELKAEIMEISELSYLRSLMGNTRLWFHNDLQALAGIPDYAKLGKTAIQLVEEYHKGNYVGFINSSERLCSLLILTPKEQTSVKSSLARFLGSSFGTDWMDETEPALWSKRLEQMGQLLLSRKSAPEQRKQDWIDQVIEYIEKNYSIDITVTRIAEQFRVSPNYFSTQFRKLKGVTFIQYLTRLRMLKAKELLSNPSAKVNEAAEQVGYYSTRHFTKLFKEFVGCYPSEYSKNSKNSKN